MRSLEPFGCAVFSVSPACTLLTVHRYVYTNNAGEEHEKEVLIGETDQLWPIVRHWCVETDAQTTTRTFASVYHTRTRCTHSLPRHIADTIKYVIENFNEFVRTNKAAEMKNKPKEVLFVTVCVRLLCNRWWS